MTVRGPRPADHAEVRSLPALLTFLVLPLLVSAVYLWFAAVRNLPRVRARKRARRGSRTRSRP